MNSKVTLVDGKEWYELYVSTEVLLWLRTQDKASWYEHRSAVWFTTTVDISAELFTVLQLIFAPPEYKIL